ncbi:hypothetical protein [Granulicoccus sp. GXG6511]|uniref:hypothetical protein n=1 Tax=Granulicoccus sp. GXG6511 TaxID=3381351 RepID=UPI003D7F07D8
MALYAKSGGRRTRQILTDVFVVAWIGLWAWIAHTVWSALMAVAEPARRTATAAARMREDFRSAGDSAGGIPVAGGELRKPFDAAGGSIDQVVAAAEDQVRTIERLAVLCGVLLFVAPVGLLLLVWLPARLRFVRRSTSMDRLLDSSSDLELLALRAMANQPVDELARISADPIGDWRAQQWPVIMALADLELRANGLQMPQELRSPPHQ